MSYIPVPPDVLGIKPFLENLSTRKEFRVYQTQLNPISTTESPRGFIDGQRGDLFMPGLRLNGAQSFIRNFENPNTGYTRVLVNWQTGVGKSIAAISIAQEFVSQYRARAAIGDDPPSVHIISFTARETILEDMLRFPEFGFISQAEVDELKRLRVTVASMGASAPEARQLACFKGILRRRITDRNRGGFYKFYGYKEFTNKMFTVTQRGRTRGFDVQQLYSVDGVNFSEHLSKFVRRGVITVNEQLLDSMRGGLLIADEIHNVYNIAEKNNYGVAIQYVLDVLDTDAPRSVFMSATPVTGNAGEVVDLLNLLVPKSELPNGVALKRTDFFMKSDSEFDTQVSKLRDGALEMIATLSAGRVSYLLDSDVNAYPERIFVGESVSSVPYLKLTLCPMSPLHMRTLNHEQASAESKTISSGLSPGAYTLYDMVFPNPKFKQSDIGSGYGLYKSGETPTRLLSAPSEWRDEFGIGVETGSKAGVSPGTHVISGTFLGAKDIKNYSTKYAKIASATIDAIRAGSGKIMIYHHRVRMSGVLLLQEVLRLHGIADENSSATDFTLCAICGIARSVHDEGEHEYMPARFVVAHGDTDSATRTRSISKFNMSANIDGYNFRIIIGSRVVREGLNFKGVRHQFIASLPTDFPTLIQVFGRVVRKNSHNELPPADRNVKIRVFVSTRPDNQVSPELQRYIAKGQEYLVIQEVERVLHRYAVDGFANYKSIRAAMSTDNHKTLEPSLDSLPYEPLVRHSAAKSDVASFTAYGYGDREVTLLVAVCRVLFGVRPVWTYSDLWAAIQGGAVGGVNYNPAEFDEGNFAIALSNLAMPAGNPPTVVVHAGRFYTLANVNSDGKPIVDVESYLHTHTPITRSSKVSVRLSKYIRESKTSQNFMVRIDVFNKRYLMSDSKHNIEMSLVEYGADFHFAVLRMLITQRDPVTADDNAVVDLYRQFKVVVSVRDTKTADVARIFRGSRTRVSDELVGYVTPESVNLYDPAREEWYNASHSVFNIGRRHIENNIVVGFVVSQDTGSFAVTGTNTQFKIRAPIQKLNAASSSVRVDARNLARGGVCETRNRAERAAYVDMLRTAVRKVSNINTNTAQNLSSAAMCRDIKKYLLMLERHARSPQDGMTAGVRWLYIFSDKVPSISALIRPK